MRLLDYGDLRSAMHLVEWLPQPSPDLQGNSIRFRSSLFSLSAGSGLLFPDVASVSPEGSEADSPVLPSFFQVRLFFSTFPTIVSPMPLPLSPRGLSG